MDKELLEKMRVRDYLSKENNYAKDKDTESVLICGRHYDKNPEVTIIMPTYRRGELLIRAINSILNQVDYDDYQLLIVDNEDIFDKETETEQIIRSFNNDKIIYYRNKVNIGMYGNWNRCMELAKSEWVCMVHDDDVLVANHLSVMMKVLREHPEIDFLSCDHLYLDERKEKLDNIEERIAPIDVTGNVVKQFTYFDFCSDFDALYLGAVYKKSCAMDIGGFMPRSTLIEDYIFVSKMSYYHNVYALDSKLYGYYWGQNESLNLGIWMEQSVWQYFLTKFIANKRSIFLRGLFRKRSKYMVIDLVNRHNRGESFLAAKCDIDLDELADYCDFGKPNYMLPAKKMNSLLVNISDKIRNKNRKIFTLS